MRTRARRFLLPSLASLVTVTLAFACGTQEVTIPNSVPPDSSTERDSATDTTVPDASIPDAALDVPVVCPEVLPNDATGVYVSPGGVNDVACGTRAAPCKTVAVGITHAVAASRPKVYVSRGTYVERIALTAGVEVVGGWDVPAASTKWQRACTTPGQIVVLRAPAAQSMTVEARDLGGEAALSLLRIESKLPAQVNAGESLYGVVAVGSTTTLRMRDVSIEIGAGGPGVSAAKAGNGPAAVGTCPTGTGVAGTAGAQGAGASIGSFDVSGYQPAVAASGVIGAAGANGLAGAAGTCVTCGSCAAAVYPLCDLVVDAVPIQSCGKAGASGCGGGSGGSGGAATGGGSSIGVYAWDATVTIDGGKIKSGDAGNGGTGGSGGAGGASTAGAVGAPGDLCVTGCAADLVNLKCVEKPMTRGLGGAAGGAGGLGGAGGTGGGGGGGSSFAIYQGSLAVVTPTGTNLGHGNAGTGGGVGAGAGSPGAAADRVP